MRGVTYQLIYSYIILYGPVQIGKGYMLIIAVGNKDGAGAAQDPVREASQLRGITAE